MTASWVIVDRSTGKAVMETFERKTADHVSTMQGYEVVPIMQYLQGLNKQQTEKGN